MTIIKSVLSPVFIIIFCLIIGMISMLRKREMRAKYFVMTATVLIFLFSFTPFSKFLVWGLERNYAPLMNFSNLHDIHYLVVLTAWDADDPTVPYTSNIGYSSALRVLEAHRIYMNLPQCKIIISGGPFSAKLMTKLMVLLGIQEENIIIDDHAANTWESAINIKKIISGQPFVLVTSAIHLPRAMKSFIRHGLRPIPAPADFSYGYYQHFKISLSHNIAYYMPNIDSFLNSHSAIYEYLGIFWYDLKSFFKFQ